MERTSARVLVYRGWLLDVSFGVALSGALGFALAAHRER